LLFEWAARLMPPASVLPLREQWRREVCSNHPWKRDGTATLAPGEAGGFRVCCDGVPFGAYLKPTRRDSATARAANEKIVADLAADLGFDVPSVLLYRRPECPPEEETHCCVSLIQYPEQYEWRPIWNLAAMDQFIKSIVTALLARYSGNVALDLWIGQTDRNNERNAIFGIDPQNKADGQFMFLDHSYSLNKENRWRANDSWRTIEMVPLPAAFRESLVKNTVVEACDRIAAFTDDAVVAIVNRIPEEFMSQAERQTVITALTGRKGQLREFIERNL